MQTLIQDVRQAVRTLRRTPGLVATAILSLGLGIGAATAVFSFVNAIQLRALPFADERTLVGIEETSATELCAGCGVGTSYATFLDWRARATSFQTMGAYTEGQSVISGGPGPERVAGAQVTAGLFRMLGLAPVLGRDLSVDDERPDAEPVVILSDLIWQRRFASDPRVLDQTMKIDGIAHTIVGVMPVGFRFPEYAQFWTPFHRAAREAPRSDRSVAVIARLLPGATMSRAAAEMQAIARSVAAEQPATNARWTVRVRSLREAMTEETAMASLVLLGAVGFVLMIACANVSNLLLVRASEREREIAIRTALGCSRLRVAGLILTESAVLTAAGGALGLLIALWTSGLVSGSLGVEAPYWIQFGIDWRMFAFCAVVTATVAMGLGLLPAVHASRVDPHSMLKDGGAGATAGRRGRRVAGALVVTQLALALLLLAGAGLLIKTVARTYRFDPGFDTTHMLIGDVSLAGARYDDPGQVRAFAGRLLEDLERRPGVRAAVSHAVFFRGFGAQARHVQVEGMDSVPDDASPAFYHAITPGYFRTLGVPVRAGREFSPDDSGGVVIVNEAMAERIWPQAPALGRRIRFADGPWLTVIGVVANEGGSPLARRRAAFAYVPFATEPGRQFAVTLRTPGDPSVLIPEVRAAVRVLDPDQPIEDLQTMEEAFRRWVAPARFVGLLMSSLSAIAVALAAIGLYGVMAYSVRRRLREIGIRLAIGGAARDVVLLIVFSACRLILPGIALGLLGAWAGTRALEGVLLGTSPTDPIVFAAVTALLALVALAASWLPARKGARVDPLIILRSE